MMIEKIYGTPRHFSTLERHSQSHPRYNLLETETSSSMGKRCSDACKWMTAGVAVRVLYRMI